MTTATKIEACAKCIALTVGMSATERTGLVVSIEAFIVRHNRKCLEAAR